MDTSHNTNSITKSIISFIVFVGVVIGAVALAMSSKKNDAPAAPNTDATTNTNSTPTTGELPVATTTDATSTPTTGTSSTSAAMKYKDGTYASTGTYKSPAGIEQINLSVEIKNDTVVETEFKGLAENSRSINFQEQFANEYRKAVIGRKVDDIVLGKVSGSSLTPVGFNDAFGKIKDEAAL